jgi:hypothetical protein
MALSERDEIEETALPAVLVRRSDLPVPLTHRARSFFGGLPRLPPELEWPTAEVRANKTLETVALTFVAQIDPGRSPGLRLVAAAEARHALFLLQFRVRGRRTSALPRSLRYCCG